MRFAAITLYTASWCICIKFCFKLRNARFEMYKMLKTAFSANAMGRIQILNTSVDSNMGKPRLKIVSIRVVCPRTKQAKMWKKFAKLLTKTNVRKIVNKDWQSTTSEITGRWGLSHGTCKWIQCEDLNVWQISAKFVHWLLMNKHKQKKFLAIKTWMWSPTTPLTCHIWLFVIYSSYL